MRSEREITVFKCSPTATEPIQLLSGSGEDMNEEEGVLLQVKSECAVCEYMCFWWPQGGFPIELFDLRGSGILRFAKGRKLLERVRVTVVYLLNRNLGQLRDVGQNYRDFARARGLTDISEIPDGDGKRSIGTVSYTHLT